MKLAILAVTAAFALLLLAPSATAACPPNMPPDRYMPPCTESPILISVGNCADVLLAGAHDWQVYAGEVVSCL